MDMNLFVLVMALLGHAVGLVPSALVRSVRGPSALPPARPQTVLMREPRPGGPAGAAPLVAAVLEGLAERAATAPGAAGCRAAVPADSAAACRDAYAEVAEAMRLESPPPFSHRLDIDAALDAMRRSDATLADLADIGAAVAALQELAAWARGQPESRLAQLAAEAAPPERLGRLVGAVESLEDGTLRLSSDAFPLLRTRRVQLYKAERAEERAAEALLADPAFRKRLADPDATIQRRDGRLTVPVRPVQKSLGEEVRRSRSGQTVYVEPHALEAVSSDVRTRQRELAIADARLRAALAERVLAFAPSLGAAVDAAGRLDAVLARARLAADWAGALPEVGDEGMVRVEEARHPVLALRAAGNASASVVGNGVYLAPTERAQGLLLSGPNGGGKSVVLQMVAAYVALARLGVPLPCCAATSPRVDFFTRVCTDLSDGQDLEDGASSFAAHLRACGTALRAAEAAQRTGDHVLAVFDEPGAATDPAQGAAIAQAVLERLLDADAVVLAATHSDALKNMGLADERWTVAAMARSADGAPLYKLLPGAVGSSHALDAARREGLPEEVLDRAAALLPEQGPQAQLVEDLVGGLQARLSAAAEAGDNARRDERAAAAARAEAESAAAKAAQALAVSESFLKDQSRRVDTLVQRLRRNEDGLEVLGQTLGALRLAEKDATIARTAALAALGLQPVPATARLEAGQPVLIVPDGAGGDPLDAVVAQDSEPLAETANVEIAGMPAAPIARSELATWLGGQADDFARKVEVWAGRFDKQPVGSPGRLRKKKKR